jgi:MarR family transcriptional regulator, 2-MHQ and catechol-resistance regulon repressor
MRRKMQTPEPPAPDTRGVHLWLVLWRAYDALRACAERNIAAQGLGFSDFAVLESLLHLGPLPVNTIGPKVRLTSGSISVAVDRLEARGLVERRGVPGDRRTRVVHLTRAGRTLAQRAFASHEAAMEEAAAALAPAERAHLLGLLRRLGLAAQAGRDPL